MQNTAATVHHHEGGPSAQWAPPPPPMQTMYPQQHQRQPSNPRAYAVPSPSEPEGRGEQGGGEHHHSQHQHPPQHQHQQQQYSYQGGYGMGYPGYPPINTPYPPSTSRRTSGPKASTPPTSAPPPQSSPQYFPQRSETFPASAPPQITTHHASMNQPQTAHPYYTNYHYDYGHQGSWYYPQQARPQPSSTTPTLPPNPAIDSQRSASFEYPSYPYQADRSQFRPQNFYPPPAQMPPQMPPSYQWQQPFPYYPPGPAAAPPAQPATATTPPTPSSGKKGKGKKEEYSGLGKRPPDSEDEDEKKKKKGVKKEEEKPVVIKPAKSHLHPPRQAQSAWQLFFTDELNKAKAAAAHGNSPGGTPHQSKLNVAQIAKDAGIAYANLNDEQKAFYAEKVQESKDQYAKELSVWQATLTPEDIRAENAFRAQQRKEGKSRKGNLKDPNAPKKPLSAYFLFLKSIREDEELRAKVWGEETETTKQSVLAAERWRGLTDEEKKPYLSRAERDKQEYESARKIYEDDAAARARGEDVPVRPTLPETPTQVEIPKSLKEESKPDFLVEAKPFTDLGETAFEHTIEMDDYHGFHDPLDPLEGMDLSGLEGMAATDAHEGQWDELQALMGTVDAKVSIAPALSQESPPRPTSEDRNVAAAAEGITIVPAFDSTDVSSSGVPTEEVNEMPLGGPAPEDPLREAPTDPTDTEHLSEPFETAAHGGIIAHESVEVPAADGV